MTSPRILFGCLAYALAVVALAFGADRAISGRLFAHPGVYVPTFRTFTEFTSGEKMAQLRQLKGRPVDGLVIGDSQPEYGVNPVWLDAGLERHGIRMRSYNAAIPSAGLDFWPRFLGQAYRATPPCTLLLGVQPRALDVNGLRDINFAVNFFFGSEGFASLGRNPVAYWSDERLSSWFRLWGRRGDVYKLALGQLLTGERYQAQVVRVTNQLGWTRWGDRTYDPNFHIPAARLAAQARRAAVSTGRVFTLAPSAVRSLTQLAAGQAARGGRLVLFTSPVLFDQSGYASPAMEREMRRFLRRFAARHAAVVFVDAARRGPPYTAQDFGDGLHLNGRGARRFTRELADALAPKLASAPSPGAPCTNATLG